MIATETYQYGISWLHNSENAVANPHFKEYMKRDLTGGIIDIAD